MNTQSVTTMNISSIVLNALSWVFGVAVLAVGVLNTFWGNDPGFGIFLVLLAFLYFPPVDPMIKGTLGFSIPWLVKLPLAILIIIAALGVGELFAKIDLMLMDV